MSHLSERQEILDEPGISSSDAHDSPDGSEERIQALKQQIWEMIPSVRMLVRRRFSGRDDSWCDDVLQSAAMQATRKMSTFQGKSRLETWFTKIALRTAQDAIRKKTSLQLSQEAAEERLESAVSNPLTALIRSELREIVRDTLETLPEEPRTILTLSSHGLGARELSSELGIVNIDTVKTKLHRARRLLREILEQKGVSHEDVLEYFAA